MSIAKYNKNLHASEVFRELERQAAKKGFFNPTEEEQVTLAAQTVAEKKVAIASDDLQETEDLVLDVAMLATALRDRGLTKQADEIENNLVMFKQAESALYNVTEETNKDFIDFAHREGDFQVVPGDYGAVETVESAAEKILAVVRKTPTGKLPKEASLAGLASLIKEAELPAASTTGAGSGNVETLKVDYDTVKKYLDELARLFVMAGDGKLTFSIQDPLHGKGHASALFNMLTNNGYQPLNTYGVMAKSLFAGGNESKNTIAANIRARGNDYLRSILSGRYVIASREDELLKMADPRATFAPHLIQQDTTQQQAAQSEMAKIEQQADVTAQKIWNDYEAAKSAAIDAVNKANTQLARLQADANQIKQHLSTLSDRPLRTAQDYRAFSAEIARTIPQLRQRAAWPVRILNGFGKLNEAAEFKTNTDSLDQANRRLSAKAEVAAKAAEDDKLDEGRVRATLGRLKSIVKQLEDGVKNYGMKNVQGTIDDVNTFISEIQKRYGSGSISYLLEGLKNFGDYKDKDGNPSYQALDNDTMALLESVKKDIAAAKKKAEEK